MPRFVRRVLAALGALALAAAVTAGGASMYHHGHKVGVVADGGMYHHG